MSSPSLRTPDRPVVLIVDDDPTVRRTIARLLEGAFETREVGSGPEAVDWRGDPPALFVIDYQMPTWNGRETVERIRAAGTEVPVIMVSAVMDAMLAGTLLGAGANACLHKLELFDRLAATARALVTVEPR